MIMANTEKRRTLLDISEDMMALDALLDEVGGDISDPSVEAAITEWFKEVSENESEKVGNYIGLIREKELRAAAMKAEAERYQHHARVLENAAKGLKDRLQFYMELHDKKKIETPRGNATVCANGGKLPLRLDPNVQPDELPPRFHKVSITINQDAVRDAIAQGETFEWATIEERGNHIRIK